MQLNRHKLIHSTSEPFHLFRFMLIYRDGYSKVGAFGGKIFEAPIQQGHTQIIRYNLFYLINIPNYYRQYVLVRRSA